MNNEILNPPQDWQVSRTRPDRGPQHDGPPILIQLLDIVRRRKWIIIGSTLAVFMLGLVGSLLMTPRYTASAVIEIQREDNSMIEVDGASSKASMIDQEFYETQYGLLRSQTLAERVAQRLRLQDNQKFFEEMGVKPPAGWFVNGHPTTGAKARNERRRVAGELLLKTFNLEPDRLSRLVRLRFTSPDPALSQSVVNAWAKEFVQLTQERKIDASAYAREFLENRLNQLRGRIDSSERQLVDYASRESIVNLPGTVQENGKTSGERSLLVDDLSTLNQELSRATADRVRAESRLASGSDTSTEALDNTALAGLRQKRAEVAADYAKMMTQFQPDYPPARGLKSQLDQLDRAINSEVSRVGGSISSVYRAARDREVKLQRQVDQLTQRVLDLRRRSIQYNILEREADTNRQLYDGLLQRYKAIGVGGGVGTNNILMVDQAQLPERPSSPKLLLNLLFATMAGFGIGLIAAFLREQIDQGVSDPAQVERTIGVPLLGTVPRSDGELSEQLRNQKSSIGEAYLSLRTKLGFATDHGLPRTLGVTSSQPMEGKSTTSLALAQSIARSGKRVLLVDADMRSPSQHVLVGVANDAGLSNVLSGGATIAQLAQPTEFANMFILPGGPTPPSAPELLASSSFDAALTDALTHFDHIVFDAPPVMGLADAPILGSKVEGIVFVIEFARTKQGMAQVAVDRLMGAHANLLGVVLTKFDSKRASSSYGYDYGYGYGYGEHRN